MKRSIVLFIIILSVAVALLPAAPAAALERPKEEPAPVAKGSDLGKPVKEEIVAKGTKIEFTVKPVAGLELMEGRFADIAITVTDATTGNPITPVYPGAWIDLKTGGATGKEAQTYTCDQKVQLYFKGIMTFRPLLDLNSYYILAMNHDATISVIDPIIGMQNITHLYTMIHLKKPGEDWTFGREEKDLFVTPLQISLRIHR